MPDVFLQFLAAFFCVYFFNDPHFYSFMTSNPPAPLPGTDLTPQDIIKALTTKGDDVPCSICGETDSDELNPIVFCEKV